MNLDENISAVITGGASGLGEATARELSKFGVKCALFDLNAEKGEAVASDIGGVFCEANVTSDESVVSAFEKARSINGQERILINCAGIGIAVKTAARDKKTGDIVPHPLDPFNTVIQINLIGSFRCIAYSSAGMMSLDPTTEDGGRGAVVNTASVAAEDGQIGQAAYSASKGGVVGMTLPVARDLAATGIRVNTIAPGLIDTPIYGEGEQSDQFKAHLGQSVLFPKRLGYGEELAFMVMECLTNPYMNGETIRCDGGIRMPPK